MKKPIKIKKRVIKKKKKKHANINDLRHIEKLHNLSILHKRRDELLASRVPRREVIQILAKEYGVVPGVIRNKISFGGRLKLDLIAVRLDMIRLLKKGESSTATWEYLARKYGFSRWTLQQKVSIREAYRAIAKNKVQSFVDPDFIEIQKEEI